MQRTFNASRASKARGVAAAVLAAMAWPGEALAWTGQPLAYVANSGDNTVSVIDTGDNTVVDTISVGTLPGNVVVAPDGTRVYVANVNDSTVSVIETVNKTDTVAATIPLVVPTGGVGIPTGVAITPDGTRVYVTDSNYLATESIVWVIDSKTNTVDNTISVGYRPDLMAVTPDGKHVYLSLGSVFLGGGRTYISTTVQVIDTATNMVVDNAIQVGSSPTGLAVTPDGTRVYVASGSSPLTVFVIATATNTVANTIQVQGGVAGGIAIIPSPQGAPFPSFKVAKLDINLGQNFFKLRSEFTSSSTAQTPIDPTSQPLKLQVGPFITTIPAGSFQPDKQGGYAFKGAIDGVELDVKIKPTGTLRYALHATANGANMSGAANPVQVSLGIDGYAGLTNVTAQFDQGQQASSE